RAKRGAADRAGRLAAQWLRAAIKPGAALGDPYDAPHVLEDVQRYVRTIARAAGELGGRAGAVRDQLAANMPPPGCTDLRHGGFYLSHVFDLVDGPGVIDWDTFRQGPAEVDAGMLCAAARWEMYQPEYERATQRAIGVFLDEVDDLVDPARLRWYRTAALLKLGSGAQGNEVNRSLKSVWFAAPPSMGLTLKISSTVRSVELWSLWIVFW